MGHITKYPFTAHYQGTTTDHVIRMKRGKVITNGVGQHFWFRPGTTTISEVPAIDFERVSVLTLRTFEQQELSAQVSYTYRFADPMAAAARLDFAIHPAGKENPARLSIDRVGELIGRIASSVAADIISQISLNEALRTGVAKLDAALSETMKNHPRLQSSGIQVVDCRVLFLRPEADVEKALQTPLREQLQASADKALYERRAQAVEQERVISENELQAKIELAIQDEKRLQQEGANARLEAQEEAAAWMIRAQGEAERMEMTAQSRAKEITLVGDAENAIWKGQMEVNNIDGGIEVLQALALREAALRLPDVGQINLTPDLLSGLLGKLVASKQAPELK